LISARCRRLTVAWGIAAIVGTLRLAVARAEALAEASGDETINDDSEGAASSASAPPVASGGEQPPADVDSNPPSPPATRDSAQVDAEPKPTYDETKLREVIGLGWTIKPSRDTAAWYVEPREPNYWLAVGWQLTVLLAGVGYYYIEKDVNSIDWYYDYSFTTFRDKLIGKGYAFDSNIYDTNFISHSVAGTLYYAGARGSRVGPMGALGIAVASSALWELLGEYRERAALNDMLATPFGGAAFGESLFQLGALFDRSCDSGVTRALAGVFAPGKALADYLDDADPLRPKNCSAFGLPRLGDYRIDLSIGPRWIHSWGETPAESRPAAEAILDTEIINLRRWGRPGRGWTSFSDGNISSLAVTYWADEAGRADVRVRARSAFGGLHYRNIEPVGPGRHGMEFVLSAGLGVEYSRHRYGTKLREDPMYVLELPSVQGRARWTRGHDKLDFQVVLATTYAGAGSFALEKYAVDNPRSELTSAAEHHGYNHALGVSLIPRAVYSTPSWRLGLHGRSDRMFVVRALDGDDQITSHRPASERRYRGELWFEYGPPRGFRWHVDVAGAQRRGNIDAYRTSMEEVSVGTALKYGF